MNVYCLDVGVGTVNECSGVGVGSVNECLFFGCWCWYCE